MKKLSILTSIILFLLIVVNLAFFIKSHLAIYTYPINPAFLEKLYGQSQYVRMDPISILPDETVYAYASWRYMHGENPAMFNADQPPLGKYFIGLSEIYFNNERLTGPVFNVLSLVALFVLSCLVLKDYFWSIILVTFFSFEKLFTVQMLYAPLLDNIQLFFILLSFIFYILSLKKPRALLVAMLMLGFVMSVKFWVTGVVIYVIWLIHKIFAKNIKGLLRFLVTSPLIIFSMLLVYLPSFLQGDSLRRFFGVQKYIFEFHRAKIHMDPVAVWDLLFFNRWHVPWEGVIKQSVDWQWTWPLITAFSLITAAIVCRQKISKGLTSEIGVVVIWLVAYFFLLLVGAVVPRYLLPVMPAMYILSFWLIKEFLARIHRSWYNSKT